MITEIAGYPLLRGARNTAAADTGALIDIIRKVSRLAEDVPEIVALDLNPVLVYETGACAVDARIILNTKKGNA
jgi:acyl-CoA synthetase (NDP forming)